MDDLDKIFEKLDKKKDLISEYSDKMEELENNEQLSKMEIYKQSKALYKMFMKEMKSIDKQFK